MYIIKSPLQEDVYFEGDHPLLYILEELKAGKQLVIISTYSNTIKIPSLGEINGEIAIESFEVNF